MQIEKICNSILKSWFKGERITAGYYNDESVGITCDGKVVYFIPVRKFPLDMEQMLGGRSYFEKFIKEPEEAEAVKLSNEIRVLENFKVQKLISQNHEVWVNTDYFKYFSKDACFFVYDVESPMVNPVMVYENRVLVGLICRVNYKEGGKEE